MEFLMVPHPKKRILIVEDDPSTALLLQRWLVMAGYEVVHTTTAERALAEVDRDASWDLVLADVVLPGRSGLQLLENLRSRMPGLPTIVMTAERASEVGLSAMDQGALSFLLKPLQRETLVERLKNTFDWLETLPVVLAVGSAPGLVEASIGGTLLAHQHAGHRIILVAFCQDRYQIRDAQREFSEAARTLGAIGLLRSADPRDLKEGGAVLMLQELMEQYCPTWVYTHAKDAVEPYQKMVGKAVVQVADSCPNLLTFQVGSGLAQPSAYLDISPYLDTKLEALRPYAPSFLQQPFLRPDMTRHRAMTCGRSVHMAYAESFTVLRGRAFQPISEMRLSA